jgi:sec-independent protein translocase protein TatA
MSWSWHRGEIAALQSVLFEIVDNWKVPSLNDHMNTLGTTLGFLPNLGWFEMLIIGAVMLLLFGRRLPEVGRSLGQGIVQFKKGLKEVGDEINVQSTQSDQQPKFDSAKAPNNPDLSGSAHTTATPVASNPDSSSQENKS